MSGLLRRFRRPKPKEDEEEPAETPSGRTEEDSDIYPHRAPTRKRDRDIEPDVETTTERVSEDDAVAEPPGVPEEIGPPVADDPSGEPVSAPERDRPESPAPDSGSVEPTPDLLASVRPPLPEADAGTGRTVHRPLSPPSRCFLCGTEMSGAFCPTCRMTWNE